ncbi:hypothetical protein LTR08_003730 [Meristemomyces frigidus]|nr:hypothetical protein LTR08_003730 [Meristemomyces frigidus]
MEQIIAAQRARLEARHGRLLQVIRGVEEDLDRQAERVAEVDSSTSPDLEEAHVAEQTPSQDVARGVNEEVDGQDQAPVAHDQAPVAQAHRAPAADDNDEAWEDVGEDEGGVSDAGTLSSGVSDDSSDDGNDGTGRGRGNFVAGRQRAPRYSNAEKHKVVSTYGKYFGRAILPDGAMQKIRRAHNKWLRESGVMHDGQQLKRSRHGLRQQEQKLFGDGWLLNAGVVTPAPPRRRKNAKK